MAEQSTIFSIGKVQSQPEGAGFAIGDTAGAPIAFFSYPTEAEAEAARRLAEAMIRRAVSIEGYARSAPRASRTIPIDRLNASNDE
jgi:hypothetical protein